MHTTYYKINHVNKEMNRIVQAGQMIRDGGLVAFPTETVYGLGANGLDESSVQKIFMAKGRPSDNPLILHIAHLEDVNPLVKMLPEKALQLAERFWPGPLTLIFKRSELVPETVSGGLSTVAIRMPDHPVALALIEASGVPLAAPSANRSGRPSPTTAQHVLQDLEGRIDYVLDGGPTGLGLESTVLDLTVDVPTILRPGAISREDLLDILNDVAVDEPSSQQKPKAPGMKYTHYAPQAPVFIMDETGEAFRSKLNALVDDFHDKGQKVGVLVTHEDAHRLNGDVIKVIGSKYHLASVAANLFKMLREFDETSVDIILAQAVPEEGWGIAIMNRLIKAAGGKKL